MFADISSNSVLSYVQITISSTNVNTGSSTANQPYMITINPSQYSKYLANNLQNVNFQDGSGNIIPSWLEGNPSAPGTESNTMTSANYWLNFTNGLNYSIPNVVYLCFYNTSVNAMNGTTTGAEPLYTSTYAEYDNGSDIFPVQSGPTPGYTNFAGTSVPQYWTNNGWTVNNGLFPSTSSGESGMAIDASFGFSFIGVADAQVEVIYPTNYNGTMFPLGFSDEVELNEVGFYNAITAPPPEGLTGFALSLLVNNTLSYGQQYYLAGQFYTAGYHVFGIQTNVVSNYSQFEFLVDYLQVAQSTTTNSHLLDLALGVGNASGYAAPSGSLTRINWFRAYIPPYYTIDKINYFTTFNVTINSIQPNLVVYPFSTNITQFGSKTVSLGQTTMSKSIPVVVASDQSTYTSVPSIYTISVSTTVIQLTSAKSSYVLIENLLSSKNSVYIGNSSVTTSSGLQLLKGQTFGMPVSNPNIFYLISDGTATVQVMVLN